MQFNSRWMTYELLSRERSTSCSSSSSDRTEQVQSCNRRQGKLFGGLDGVDMEELERALTIVKNENT